MDQAKIVNLVVLISVSEIVLNGFIVRSYLQIGLKQSFDSHFYVYFTKNMHAKSLKNVCKINTTWYVRRRRSGPKFHVLPWGMSQCSARCWTSCWLGHCSVSQLCKPASFLFSCPRTFQPTCQRAPTLVAVGCAGLWLVRPHPHSEPEQVVAVRMRLASLPVEMLIVQCWARLLR